MGQDQRGAWGGALAVPGPGSQLAGYVLEQQIGAGGMAVVYRARDVRLGRLVALKVMAQAMAGDETFRLRFVREARAAAAVDDPHIIPVYEAGDAGGVLFIAMRFVNGGDVRSLLYRQGPLSPRRIMSIISPVASALDAAHAVGLVHRDVKPANMLVDTGPGRPDHVYLSDFGLSKGMQSRQLTGSGQFLGTPDYTAPEQIEGAPADGRTDQYALACSAFELLTGTVPFARDEGWATVWAHLNTPPPALTALLPGLPPATDAVFARGMAKNPRDRYPSCLEFADELGAALSSGSYSLDAPVMIARGAGPAPATTGVQRARPIAATSAGRSAARARRRRRRVIVLAGAVLACAAVTAALVVPHLTGGRAPSTGTGKTSLAGQNQRSGAPLYGIVAAFSPPQVAGRWQDPTSVAFTPDGKILAVGLTTGPSGEYNIGTAEGKTYLYDAATGKQAAVMAAGGGSVALGPSGLLAASGGTGQHDVYLARAGGITSALPGTGGLPITTVALSPDGRLVAASDSTGSFYLWSTLTRKPVPTEIPGEGAIFALAFSPDGKMIAVATPGSISLWSVGIGSVLSTLPLAANEIVNSMAYSPDGRLLAAALPDGVVGLWNTATGARVGTLRVAGGGAVTEVAFSPDGKTLAGGDANGRIYLWNAYTGKPLVTLTDPVAGDPLGLDAEPLHGVESVAFSPDGKTLATTDTDGSAYLWRVGLPGHVVSGHGCATLAHLLYNRRRG